MGRFTCWCLNEKRIKCVCSARFVVCLISTGHAELVMIPI